jgi:hypothetical protein
MNRAKARDAKIASQALMKIGEHASTRRWPVLPNCQVQMQPQLNKADWATKREIIRAIAQRIEIGPTNIVIVLRLTTDKSIRVSEAPVVTLSRA